MRDLETISVALTAAETGHLVFATLHTQDAAQTIDRVIDVFPPHQQAQVRTQLGRRAPGRRLPDAAPSAPTARAAPSPPRSSSPRPPSATSSARARRTRSTRRCRPAREQGMHTMDQHLAELVKTGQDHLRDRPREVPPRRGLQPADRPVLRRLAGCRRPGRPGQHGRLLVRRQALLMADRDEDVRVRGPGHARQDRQGSRRGARTRRPSPTGCATMGLAAVSITEVEHRRPQHGDQHPRLRRNKITLKDLAIMSRQLATMIDSGLSLLRALTHPRGADRDQALAKVLAQVRNDVEIGTVVLRRRSASTPTSSRRS